MNNMKWIDVKEDLPAINKDVLVMIEMNDGTYYPSIRWRSPWDDVVVDENGFTIYTSSDKRVVAWMDIPEYNSK